MARTFHAPDLRHVYALRWTERVATPTSRVERRRHSTRCALAMLQRNRRGPCTGFVLTHASYHACESRRVALTCPMPARLAMLERCRSMHSSTISLISPRTASPDVALHGVEDGNVKRFIPVTPGLRHKRMPSRAELWKGGPFKPLTIGVRKKGGRNHTGQITARRRGGGHKRRFRIIDWHRKAEGPHRVVRLEYDPNRSAHLALLRREACGTLSYILSPHGVSAGDVLQSGENVPIERGNRVRISECPSGTIVHALAYRKNDRAKIARAAGMFSISTVLRCYRKRPGSLISVYFTLLSLGPCFSITFSSTSLSLSVFLPEKNALCRINWIRHIRADCHFRTQGLRASQNVIG